MEKMAKESPINAVGSMRLHKIVEITGIIRLTVARAYYSLQRACFRTINLHYIHADTHDFSYKPFYDLVSASGWSKVRP